MYFGMYFGMYFEIKLLTNRVGYAQQLGTIGFAG